jgi:hypothetical protein
MTGVVDCRALAASGHTTAAAKSGYELPPSDAECHLPAALTGSPLRQGYHAPMGRSVTSFTVVRDEKGASFLRCKKSPIGPSR